MGIKKIKSFRKKYAKRCRSFYSSTLAGLFTGVVIGILFSLLTDIEFNRWINIFSYEVFAAAIYFLFIFGLLFTFYFVGRLCMYIFISKRREDLVHFRVNYFAGIYSASWGSSLIILHSRTEIAIYVSIMFILFYLPLEYFAVRSEKDREFQTKFEV